MASSALNQLIAAQQGPDIAGSIMGGIRAAKQGQASAQQAELQNQQISMGQKQLAGMDQKAEQEKKAESLKYAADIWQNLKDEQDPARQAALYQQGRQSAKLMGADTSWWPSDWSEPTKDGLRNAYAHVHGDALAKADIGRKPAGPESSVGKLMADRDAAAKGGATPEQLKAYDDAIAREGRVSSGGQNINVTVNPDGKQEMTKTTASDVQGKILDAEKELSSLDAIANKYSGDFLTYKGRAKAYAGKQFDRAGIESELTGFNAKRTSFKNEVNQFFNKYKKEITGAAAGEQEMIDLRNSIFNENLGPEEFRSAYNQFVEKARKNYELNKRTARTGVDVAVDPKYKDMSDADLKKALGL